MKRAKYQSPIIYVVSLQPLRETMLIDASNEANSSGQNFDEPVTGGDLDDMFSFN